MGIELQHLMDLCLRSCVPHRVFQRVANEGQLPRNLFSSQKVYYDPIFDSNYLTEEERASFLIALLLQIQYVVLYDTAITCKLFYQGFKISGP